jgi:hypothetical protein
VSASLKHSLACLNLPWIWCSLPVPMGTGQLLFAQNVHIVHNAHNVVSSNHEQTFARA